MYFLCLYLCLCQGVYKCYDAISIQHSCPGGEDDNQSIIACPEGTANIISGAYNMSSCEVSIQFLLLVDHFSYALFEY